MSSTGPAYQPDSERFMTTSRQVFTPREGQCSARLPEQLGDSDKKQRAQTARVTRRQLHTAREASIAREAMQKEELAYARRILSMQRQRQHYTDTVRKKEKGHRVAPKGGAGDAMTAAPKQAAPKSSTARAKHHLVSSFALAW